MSCASDILPHFADYICRLSYFPTSIAAAMASALGAQESSSQSSSQGTVYVLPCSDFQSGLNVGISFGGTVFSWNNDDLNGGNVDRSGTYCALNIIGSDTQDPAGNDVAIIGDAFLKNVVSVFDYSGNGRVGFLAASGTSTSSSGTTANAQSSGSSVISVSVPLVVAVAALFFSLR